MEYEAKKQIPEAIRTLKGLFRRGDKIQVRIEQGFKALGVEFIGRGLRHWHFGIDAYCQKHNKGVFEVLDHKTIKDAAIYYRDAKKDVIEEPAVSKMPTCDC